MAHLQDVGYDALTLSSVAEIAGVSSTTLYRRWSTKAQLVAEVAIELNATAVPAPQATTLRGELLEVSLGIVAFLRDPAMNSLARGLVAVPPFEGKHIRERLWASRAEVYQEIADRASLRGDIQTGTDGWSLVEAISAPIWMRMVVTDRPVDPAWVEAIVDRTLRAFAPQPR